MISERPEAAPLSRYYQDDEEPVIPDHLTSEQVTRMEEDYARERKQAGFRTLESLITSRCATCEREMPLHRLELVVVSEQPRRLRLCCTEGFGHLEREATAPGGAGRPAVSRTLTARQVFQTYFLPQGGGHGGGQA